jgi:hypothetical protein
MAAVPGEVATPRWPDPWAFLAQLPVSRQLGLDRTMWVLLTVAVLFIGVVMAVLVDSRNAVVQVQDFLFATSQIAQTTLRSVLGQVELDDLLASPNKINQQLQRIIDEHTGPWGVKVTTVEVKQVDLPQDMQRAMSQRAEAEQVRRAKVINAEGEYQAAEKLAQAARVLAGTPIAVQLRFLQTMREVASERNTTTFFPVPIDLFEPFLTARQKPLPP